MGLENLLSAVASLRQAIPDILVMIAGRGRLEATLAARIEAEGLGRNVTLLGFVADEDLPYAYGAADLSVVPTTALEGFGLIAAELLASGTPCLVTPVGGLPEVVSALSANLVLPAATPAAIAHGIGAALRGALALPDSAACSAYAAEKFAWPTIAAAVAGVYRVALA